MSVSRRFMACVRLARPGNLLIAGVSIAAGAAVGRAESFGTPAWVILAGMLVAGGGNAVNDVYDREGDRRIKPHRPIPAGHISPKGAALCSAVLFLAGWLLSLRGGCVAFGLVSGWVVLLVAYSARLKRVSLVGNLVVSAVVASAFLLGGVTGRDPFQSLIPAGLAFLFHFGREIIKDVEDREGDAATGVRTFAVRSGEGRALRLAAIVLAILIAATFGPYVAGAYDKIYLGAVILGVDLPLLWVMGTILRNPSRSRLGMVSGLLKADMVVGIACILVGAGVV